LVEPLRAWLSGFDPGEHVFSGIAGDTARMLRSDLTAARSAWMAAARSEAEQQEMQATDFLLYSDRQGHVADFHSLRVLYISRVVASGASVKEAQTLARHSTPLLTMNTYSRATLLDVAGAVSGLGDLLTSQPTRPEAEAQQATGTCGRADRSPTDVHTDVHKESAQEGSGWHSGASVRLADHTAASAAENEKTPAKAAVVGTSQGFQKQRLRSESNRRWRICNAVASPGKPEENTASASDVHTDVHSEPADPALAQVVEAWSSLPPAVRAGILAMVQASR
jgi:hypothetical protein